MSVPVAVVPLSSSGAAGQPKPLLVLGSSLGVAVERLWAPVLPLLGDRYHVLGWDLPGHGRTHHDGSAGSFRVADLASVVVELAARRGTPGLPAYYAGVSLGGATGLQAAADHPGAFAAVALVCSAAVLGTPEAWTQRAVTVRAQGTPALVEGSAARWFAPGFADREPQVAGGLLHDLAHEVDDEGYAACCEALAAYDLSDRLGEVTDPVLVLNGAADQVVPPAAAEQVASGVVDGRAVILPEVGHQAPVEDPTGTAEALLAFCR
ncbi:alpha/beta fold hydrolase [uncultured Arsenicicoccus sp.]|mgnify:CR=1 FL=1|uniref:alpha/beta fold hydrolase n=1 Tax=uncultured Arsenicicoccus sp. TaxID=491339 RepID=UPI00259A28D7|nr:alpha/beta fold hydrolase [uncultured Arsenicicoccus sp.]